MKLIRHIIMAVAVCLMAAGSHSAAQNKFEVRKVDFDKIKSITQDPKARFYYPKLIQSFKSNDTVMNFEAYRDLYYGYIFQEDYNPFRESEYGKVVESLYYKQPHSRAECDSIEKYAELSLDDNIFDLDQMKFYIYVLKEKKKYARAAVRQYRLDRLIAAIMSSGKGTKDDLGGDLPRARIQHCELSGLRGHRPPGAGRRQTRLHSGEAQRRQGECEGILLRRVAHDAGGHAQIPRQVALTQRNAASHIRRLATLHGQPPAFGRSDEFCRHCDQPPPAQGSWFEELFVTL